MENSKVVDIKSRRRGFVCPGVEYTVTFKHTPGGLAFSIDGVEESYRNRIALAAALEAAAKELRSQS